MPIVLIIILLLATSLQAKDGIKDSGFWSPVGFCTSLDSTTGEYLTTIGAPIWNYYENGEWRIVSNAWVATDSGYKCETDQLKTYITNAGWITSRVIWNDTIYTVQQKLSSIILVNSSTGITVPMIGLGTMTLSLSSVVGDTIKFTTGLTGIGFNVIKENGRLSHQLVFNPTFLAISNLAYGGISPVIQPLIQLTNKMEIQLTNVDNPTFQGIVNERILKELSNSGNYNFQMGQQRLIYPGSDTTSPAALLQVWSNSAGKWWLEERVGMGNVSQLYTLNNHIVIRHNDQVSIDASGIEDATIGAGSVAEYNYGNYTGFTISLTNYRTLIRVLNVDEALGDGAVISASVCSLYCKTNTSDGHSSAFRVLKPWVEGLSMGSDPDSASGGGGATWNDWDADPSEWGTAGCANASDAGIDNSGDGSDYDRWATAEGDSVSVSEDSTWYTWTISPAVAQGWYSNSYNENGVLLKPTTSIGNNSFSSTESTSAQQRPRFSFTYTTVAVGNIMGD